MGANRTWHRGRQPHLAPPRGRGVSFTSIIVVNPTTITATMKVASTASTGTSLPVTVTNNATGGYGRVTAKLLTIT